MFSCKHAIRPKRLRDTIEPNEAFGEAVHRRRRELGLTQTEVCERSGLDRSYLSGIERGKRNPSMNAMWGLANALECRLGDLIESTERLTKDDE